MVADIQNGVSYYLYDVEQITFSQVDQYAEVRLSLATAGEILSETYYADTAGEVVLRDLPALLIPYFTLPDISQLKNDYRCNSLMMTLSVKDASGTFTLNLYPYYCRIVMDGVVAEGVIQTRYKSVLTAPGREEFFPFISGPNCTLKLGVAYLQNQTAKYLVKDISLAGMAGYTSLRLSLARASELSGISQDAILYYIATLTNASNVANQVKYVVDRRAYRRQTTFLYYNCFGLPETITMLGLQTEEPELESETVRLLQREKQINVKLTDSRTVNSGYMQPDKYESLMDMLESPDIRLLEDGRNIPVVITDIDFSHQRIGNERISVSLTFRPAIRPSGRFVRANPLKGRIFDQTFDYTFD